jgi:hypothetical protein
MLRLVRFRSGSSNISTAIRTIALHVHDGKYKSSVSTFTITVSAFNDAPVLYLIANTKSGLGEGGMVTYTEGEVPVSISSSAIITDADSTTLVNATVRITAGGEHTDLLAATVAAPLQATYDNATQTLLITGRASVLAYQSALRSMTYSSRSHNMSTASRTVAFVATDEGGLSSSTSLVSVEITSVNHAPCLSLNAVAGGAVAPTFVEGGQAVTIARNVTITDADSHVLLRAIVGIEQAAEATDFLAVPAILEHTLLQATYDNTTQTLLITGRASVLAYQSALRSVTYRSTSDNPNATTRTISFIVTDTSNQSSVAVYTSLVVVAVNDVPSLALNHVAARSPQYIEGGAAVMVAPNLTIVDPDSTHLVNATVRVSTGGSFMDVVSVADTMRDLSSQLSVSYSSKTQTLVIAGAAPVSVYEQVLRGVKFRRAPPAVCTPGIVQARTIMSTITVHDSSGSGKVAAIVFPINLLPATNHPPKISLDGDSSPILMWSYTEGGSAVTLASMLSISDDHSDSLLSATVTVREGGQVGDTLSIPKQYEKQLAKAGLQMNLTFSTETIDLSGLTKQAPAKKASNTNSAIGFSPVNVTGASLSQSHGYQKKTTMQP